MKHGLMFLSDYKIIYKPVLALVMCLWQIKLISYINDILYQTRIHLNFINT
jgi:hypothetical protein